jgi:hypothetical protein
MLQKAIGVSSEPHSNRHSLTRPSIAKERWGKVSESAAGSNWQLAIRDDKFAMGASTHPKPEATFLTPYEMADPV